MGSHIRAVKVVAATAMALIGISVWATEAGASPQRHQRHYRVGVTAQDQELGLGQPPVTTSIDSISAMPAAFHPHVLTSCQPNAYVRERQAPKMHFYWLRNPHWLNQRYPGCVRTNQRTAFRVTATPPRSSDVTMYPDEIWGCEWGKCTPNGRLPIQVKNVHRMNTTWWNKRTPNVRGMYDVAYDIWLTNKRYTGGRHNGVELMIWLRHHGGCCWTKGTVGFPTVQHIDYRLMTRFMSDRVHHARWRFIEFRMRHQRFRVTGLNLAMILRLCERRGYIRPNQWLESVGAGYEIWDGAVHLTTERFAVHLNGL